MAAFLPVPVRARSTRMDPTRFDGMTRLFATSGDRRALMASIASAGTLVLGSEGADSKRKGRNQKKKEKKKEKKLREQCLEQLKLPCGDLGCCSPITDGPCCGGVCCPFGSSCCGGTCCVGQDGCCGDVCPGFGAGPCCGNIGRCRDADAFCCQRTDGDHCCPPNSRCNAADVSLRPCLSN